MVKGFLHRTFESWLKQNRKRFSHQPVIVRRTKRSYVLRFSGVTPHVEWHIHHGRGNHVSSVIVVMYRDECWDILFDSDLQERRTLDGKYYCEMCNPEHRKVYASREGFWISHAFEPMLEWTTREFKSSNHLRLTGEKGRWTAAQIVKVEDLATNPENPSMAVVLPLLISNTSS